METYKKKTKTELQKTIKQLKEENDVYQRMNKELNSKLQELVEQRYRLEIRLESVKNH
jgi:cell division protein FtsB